MRCRHCCAPLERVLVDLGSAPPSNALLTSDTLRESEKWYPLRVLVCTGCWLVQTEDFVRADELFSQDYAYFSSFSTSWLAHAERYVADMVARFGLSPSSHVVEVGANDGYLLQYVKARGVRCTAIEPAAGPAGAARARGIEVVEDFFGVPLARRLAAMGKLADLAVANNVLAHVPDITDFVAGITLLLKPDGVVTFEFPHLLRLMEQNQFDTIYHEHFSYLSFTTATRILAAAGLSVFDVEELPTHGGSLRIFAQRVDTGSRHVSDHVKERIKLEATAGLTHWAYYSKFQQKADRVRNDFLGFLIDARKENRKVAAYGAAAKGSTLINYAGVGTDLLPWVVDRNPAKQGKFLPGSRIPIVAESLIREVRPDYVLILPWNLKTEVKAQLSYIRQWDGRFVTAVPSLTME